MISGGVISVLFEVLLFWKRDEHKKFINSLGLFGIIVFLDSFLVLGISFLGALWILGAIAFLITLIFGISWLLIYIFFQHLIKTSQPYFESEIEEGQNKTQMEIVEENFGEKEPFGDVQNQ